MKTDKLLTALRRLKVETGSLACGGCGYEHSCSIRGCAILREAEATITALLADLKRAPFDDGLCALCSNYMPWPSAACAGADGCDSCLRDCPCHTCDGSSNFEWRGVNETS